MKRFVFAVFLAAAACSSKPAASTTPNNFVVAEAAISGESIVDVVKQRFPEAVASGVIVIDWGSAGVDGEVVKELAVLGITSTKQLAAIIPADYETKGLDAVKGVGEGTTNVAGLMRDLMIIHDTKGYFEKAWNESWSASSEDFPAPVAYGVDMKILEGYGVFGGGGGDPCDGGGDGYDPCGGGE